MQLYLKLQGKQKKKLSFLESFSFNNEFIGFILLPALQPQICRKHNQIRLNY